MAKNIMNIFQGHLKFSKKNSYSCSSIAGNAHNKQSGSALIVVLLLVLVGSLIAISQSSTTRTDMKIAHNNQLGVQALGVAEAGIYHAFRLIADNSTNLDNEINSGGTGGALAGLGNPTTLDGINYRHVNFGGSGASDGYYVRTEDNFDETPNNAGDDTDKTIDIISLGRVATAERVIKARLETGPPEIGLFSKQEIKLTGGSYVGSYDPTGGLPPVGFGTLAKVGSNVRVDVDNGSIYGEASVPPAGETDANGNISSGTVLVGSGSSVNNIITNAEVRNYPSVAACSPFTDLASTAGVAGSYSYSLGSGDVSVSGGNNITLAAGTYCFADFSLSGSSTLTITGPVEIYLTGDADFSGGTFINTGASPLPTDMKIFSSGSQLDLSGGSNIAISLYAPDAKIDISGGSTFYGTAIGNEVVLSGGSNFMIDESLVPADLQIISWREIKN